MSKFINKLEAYMITIVINFSECLIKTKFSLNYILNYGSPKIIRMALHFQTLVPSESLDYQDFP